MMHELVIMFSALLCGAGILLTLVSMFRFIGAVDGWPERPASVPGLRRARPLAGAGIVALAFSLVAAVEAGLGPMPLAIICGCAFTSFLNYVGFWAVLRVESGR